MPRALSLIQQSLTSMFLYLDSVLVVGFSISSLFRLVQGPSIVSRGNQVWFNEVV